MPHASRARTSRSPVARWAAGLAACALTMAAPLTGWVPAAVANTAVTEGPEDGGPPPPAWVAVDREWGGCSGYFGDPDGYRWEIACAPGQVNDIVVPGT